MRLLFNEDLPSRNCETEVDGNMTEDHESGHVWLVSEASSMVYSSLQADGQDVRYLSVACVVSLGREQTCTRTCEERFE